MAFGKLGPIGPVDQRDMGIGGIAPAALNRIHRAQDNQLAKGVVKVVVATDNMGNAHIVIIDHHREHIGRRAIRAQQHEIIELGIGHGDLALHQIGDGSLALARGLDPHHEGEICGSRSGIGVAPFAGDAEGTALGLRGFTALGQFLRREIAAIGLPCRQQLMRHFGMALGAGKLEYGRFVATKAQPIKAVENGLNRGLGRAGTVGILDSQQIFAAVVPRKQVVEQRGARAADVEIASGRGRKARDDRAQSPRLAACLANACHSLVLPVQ